LPLETSTKAVGLSLGWISVFTTSFWLFCLTLTRFEARVRFANYINTSFTPNYLTVRMTKFKGSK
jgi:hypothetical protein